MGAAPVPMSSRASAYRYKAAPSSDYAKYLNGKDLRYEQLADRKAALRHVLNPRSRTSVLQYADDVSDRLAPNSLRN